MRRVFSLVLALSLVAPLFGQPKAVPKPAPAEPSPEAPITADQLWSALMQGNQQFVGGVISYNLLKTERQELADHQLPPITILACADSRVPPELVFNQSLGALFVVREAGNVADEFSIASIEYAIAQGYTKLIVVLGHSECGAVKASLGGADPGTPSLKSLATRIRSSFIGIPYDARDEAVVRKAVEANARASAAYLRAASSLIRDAEATDRLHIISAYYDLATGVVRKVE